MFKLIILSTKKINIEVPVVFLASFVIKIFMLKIYFLILLLEP